MCLGSVLGAGGWAVEVEAREMGRGQSSITFLGPQCRASLCSNGSYIYWKWQKLKLNCYSNQDPSPVFRPPRVLVQCKLTSSAGRMYRWVILAFSKLWAQRALQSHPGGCEMRPPPPKFYKLDSCNSFPGLPISTLFPLNGGSTCIRIERWGGFLSEEMEVPLIWMPAF